MIRSTKKDAPKKGTIVANNIGKVVNAEIPYPIDPETGECVGGIVVLRGRNNCGKSTLADALDTLFTGDGRVIARDGTPSGEIQGLGMRLRAGAKTSRVGALEVHSLGGRFDLGDVVDPGIVDPVSADDRRIKALIVIAHVQADRKLFDELGYDEEIIGKDTFATDNLVEMARRLKRDLQGAALRAETEAANANEKARALFESSAGIELESPHDEVLLQTELEQALQAQAAVKQRSETADRVLEQARVGREQLTAAKEAYQGTSVERAKATELEARNAVLRGEKLVAEIQDTLRRAEQNLREAKTAAQQAQSNRERAERHEQAIAGWQVAILAAESVDNPTGQEIAQAGVRVEQAREAHSAGVLVRQALAKQAEGKKYQDLGGQLTQKADRLRNAAKETDTVLSGVVANLGVPLRVDQGRLVMNGGDQNGIPFARQSVGTRYALVAPLAVSVLEAGDVFVLKQEAWEGLDFDNRQMLLRLCLEHRVVMYTAECDAHQPPGDLRAEVLELPTAAV